MDAREITKAILQLKPNAEFTFKGNDYSTIKWDVLEGDAPTLDELKTAHETIKAAKAQAQTEAEAKKGAAEAKLAALGLTADDLKALGLG